VRQLAVVMLGVFMPRVFMRGVLLRGAFMLGSCAFGGRLGPSPLLQGASTRRFGLLSRFHLAEEGFFGRGPGLLGFGTLGLCAGPLGLGGRFLCLDDESEHKHSGQKDQAQSQCGQCREEKPAHELASVWEIKADTRISRA
jgi:hypothetical protein